MKKYFALFTLLAFVVAFAGMVYADSRTPGEKLAAGRAYLKLLDQKIIKHRNLGNTAVVKDLQAQKKSTIARMQAWKADAEGSSAPMAPPPPPPMGVKPAPAASAGLFGWGIVTAGDLGYIGGEGETRSILADAAVVFADPLSMGSMIGLSADAIAYKAGLGLTYGNPKYGTVNFNAILLTGDAILNLPAEWMGGVKSYVGAQVNFPVYNTATVSGQVGGLLYAGIKGDLELGLGGDTYAEVGYGAVRRTGQSTRGIALKVGQEILL